MYNMYLSSQVISDKRFKQYTAVKTWTECKDKAVAEGTSTDNDLYIVCVLFQLVHSENVGWKSYLAEDPTEFHDIPLVWEDPTPVPSWLSGTYVRNGPGQISFGSPRRVLTSWLEGFAKLHSFKLSGSSVLFSGAMLRSPN